MERYKTRKWRVGVLVLISLFVLVVSIFIIGKERRIFARTEDYSARFDSVTGLVNGNPVRLNGVVVGKVNDIVLSEDPRDTKIIVYFEVDARFVDRIRADSKARIKTLGLLGDKYIEISLGTADAAPLPPDSEIPSISPANIEKLVEGGEDTLVNVVEISASLKNILKRIDKGEGLLGELTRNDSAASNQVNTALGSLKRLLDDIRNGPGLANRLIYDKEFDARVSAALTGSLEGIQRVAIKLDEGPGAIPMLLNDPASRDSLVAMIASLRDASAGLQQAVHELNTGEGPLPRLLHDKEFAAEFIGDLRSVADRLSNVARKLDEGSGSAGKIINDSSIYDAMNDIIIGINESKILRWLIRNRQKAGIKKRGKEAGYPEGTAAPESTAPIPASPPPAAESDATDPAPLPPPAIQSPPPTMESPPPASEPEADPISAGRDEGQRVTAAKDLEDRDEGQRVTAARDLAGREAIRRGGRWQDPLAGLRPKSSPAGRISAVAAGRIAARGGDRCVRSC